jgi:hypothetical protein
MDDPVPPPYPLPPPPPPWTQYAAGDAGYIVPAPPKRGRRGLIIASAVVLVLLLAAAGLLLFVRSAMPSNAVKANDAAFYVLPPDGWVNGGHLAQGSYVADIYLVGQVADGFASNVNVVQPAGQYASLADFSAGFTAYQQQLTSGFGATDFTALSTLMVGGEPSYSFQYHVNGFGHTLTGEQIVVDHNNKTYFITITATSGVFPSIADGALPELLGSWHWL